MKRSFHARKQRQLKFLAKKLHRLRSSEYQAEQFAHLITKMQLLINELKIYFSKQSIHRMLGKTAIVFGLSTLGLNAQQFGEPQWSPFSLPGGDNGEYSLPSLADIDNDGDLDLLAFPIYEYTENGFQYYENIGTPESANFAEVVNNPFGLSALPSDKVGFGAIFGDLDNDGDQDIILTVFDYDSYLTSAKVHYYENAGTASEPEYLDPVVEPFGLDADGVIHSLADLDGDGDLDLVSGNFDFEYYSAQVKFSENIGTASNPDFSAFVSLDLELDDPNYAISMPAFADLDKDGDIDLFVGGNTEIGDYYYGSIFYFANNGDGTFEAGVTDPFGFEPIQDSYSSPVFGDLDNDGDMDLLNYIYAEAGNDDFSRFIYYENLESVGIQSAPRFTLSTFPNPTSNSVFIETDKQIETVILQDLTGKVLRTFRDQNTIDLEDLPPGTYLIEVKSTDGAIGTSKILKR